MVPIVCLADVGPGALSWHQAPRIFDCPAHLGRARSLLHAAGAFLVAWHGLRDSVRSCRRRTAMAATSNTPTDYYGLLGIPKFTVDVGEIKRAYHRIVKIVHPDVLGGDCGELQLLVTEAYKTLSNDSERSAYNAKIGNSHAGTARMLSELSDRRRARRSAWHPEAPSDAQGIFVDETKCVICFNCTDIAPATFKINDDEARGASGRAHVYMQHGDWQEDIDWAIESCPTAAIAYVSRDNLPMLDDVMPDVVFESPDIMMRRRAGDMLMAGGPPGPYGLFPRAREKLKREDAQIKQSGQQSLQETAAEIRRVLDGVPEIVRQEAWPEAG